MEHRSLFDCIRKLPIGNLLWLQEEGRLHVADYLNMIDRNRDSLTRLTNKRVALGDLSPLNTAILLALLDGKVASILFLPVEQDLAIQINHLAQCGVDYVITDQSSRLFDFPSATSLLFHEGQLDPPIAGDADRVSPIEQTQWIVPTSGTTGQPKLIAHTLDSLTRNMATQYVGDRYVWAMLYGIRRFAGLQVYLQSILSGTPLVFLDFMQPPSVIVEALAHYGCNALSATPTLWRQLAMVPGFERLALAQMTLGGEIADATILKVLRTHFPKARITHIYASTEAGFGFSVPDGMEGFPADYLDQPPRGVKIRVGDNQHLWLKSDQQLQRMISDEESLTDAEGWIDTGDLVEQRGDRFVFLGRASGSINVGGNKVMPEEVEKAVLAVEGVMLAVVKGKKNPVMGQLVEAYIKIQENGDFEQIKAQVLDHCRNTLVAYKVPFFIKRLDAPEISVVGKLLR